MNISTAKNSSLKTLILTSAALIAFAANSVLCRIALGEEVIDAASFTSVRLLSGAAVLFLILVFSGYKFSFIEKKNFSAPLMLFIYAAAFSFAYIELNVGTGALILFGSVQLTMIIIALFSGDRLHLAEWGGVVFAFSGFVYLILPGVTAPSLTGFLLMTIAGIAWGIYSLIGRSSKNPLADTAQNFIYTLPLIFLLSFFLFQNINLSTKGIWLAVISGGAASGLGYTIWYKALKGLTATQAAVVQLFVPVIAAAGGVIFVSEIITLRLILSGLMILGGISLVLAGKLYLIKKRVEIS